jgi:tetratricopeptide (TPR) repeat protein
MPVNLDRLSAALADRYAVIRELGRGGMAVVYLAEDLKHNRKVAIKVLLPELAAALGTDRFLREIQTVAQLNHPRILTLIDSGQADGLPYYVMPFVEGESLLDRLDREKQLAVEEAVKITREVAEALEYAHGQGVVHRDIKPGNVMLMAGGAVVADFGVARALEEAGGEKLTRTGYALGTPAYMAPENAEVEREIDGRADMYSLACVLYEMLAGDPPFTGPSAQVVMVRHATDPVPPLRSARPGASGGLEAAINKALAKVPADRFSNMADFSAALAAGAVAGPGKRAQQWAMLAVFAALVIGGAAWWVLRDEETVRQPSNIEALRLYNEGQYYLSELTEADVRRAIVLFRQALEHDSTFVPAWVGLANAYCTRSISAGTMDPREAMPNCKDAAERALAIDERVAEAHAALAQYHQDYAWDRTAAEKEANRALELDPNSAKALQILAAHHSYAAKWDEAFAVAARSIQASPADPLAWVLAGVQYYLAQRYDDALPFIERAYEISSQYPSARWLEGAIQAEQGRYEAAIERLRPIAELTGFSVWRAWLGYTYALGGEAELAQEMNAELLAEVSAGSPLSSNLSVAIAMTHIGMNNRDEAFLWLNRSAELRSTILPFVLISPVGKRLTEDPRYAHLLTRVQLPASDTGQGRGRG